MFEPEHHFFVLAKIFQRLIASRESGANASVGAGAEVGQRLRADIGKFAQSSCLRDGAVMQNVNPGKIFARKPYLPEGTNDGFSVGDVEHGSKINRSPKSATLWVLPAWSSSSTTTTPSPTTWSNIWVNWGKKLRCAATIRLPLKR